PQALFVNGERIDLDLAFLRGGDDFRQSAEAVRVVAVGENQNGAMDQNAVIGIAQPLDARRIQSVVEDRSPSRLLNAVYGLRQAGAIAGCVLPELDISAESHHESAIRLRTKDPIEEAERGSLFLGKHTLDGIADVQNDAEPQGKIVVAGEVLKFLHRRQIVEDAN